MYYLNRFIFHYIPNHVIAKIPFYSIRHFYYKRIMKIKIGKGSSIHLNNFIFHGKLIIGEKTTINRNCFLDARGSIFIGNNVSISPNVHLITADHDINSADFKYRQKKIQISDFVFIGSRATVLPGVTIGKGAVICAGAVVTKDIYDYDIVAGIPAKKIGIRTDKLNYDCSWFMPFD
jgi:acetyltransferase-like isoleucine patch superfamily enzyme